MAYKIDKNGMLQGDGLPDGVKINLDQYQKAIKDNTSKRDSTMMYLSGQNQRSTAGYVSQFKQEGGKTFGFIPQLEKLRPQGMADYGNNRINSMVQAYSPSVMGQKGAALGTWVQTQGIVLDDNTATGNATGSFTLRNEGGGPVADFGGGKGYKRLATQQAKQADELLLGNSSGTILGSSRQNAQRKTIY